MAPKHAKLQIFIQVNLYFFQNIHRWKKTKTCQERQKNICGHLMQVFYKTTTFPRQALSSGPKSGRLKQVWLYHKKQQVKQAEKLATGEVSLRFSTFRNNFNLVQRAFCGESITFLEINLVRK